MHYTTTINQSLIWKMLERPTTTELDALAQELNLHPVTREELRTPTDRGRVEQIDDYLFLVYHLPLYDETEQTSRRGEIDFIIAKNTVVTITYETMEPLEQLRRHTAALMGYSVASPYELLYHVIATANHFSMRELKHIETKVQAVGAALFKGADRALLEKISYVKRDILDFSIITASQRTTLDSLLATGGAMWGSDARVYLADLVGDLLRVHRIVEMLKATVESYSQTVSQLLELRTSEIIRRFSILGFLTFPLLLYATIALQTQVAPTFISHAGDFWFVFGVIAAIVIALAIVFRRKGWL